MPLQSGAPPHLSHTVWHGALIEAPVAHDAITMDTDINPNEFSDNMHPQKADSIKLDVVPKKELKNIKMKMSYKNST